MVKLTSFVAALALMVTPLIGQSSAEKVSQDFTKVAKKAIPAVVSITTKTSSETPNAHNRRQDPLDFFKDDFFHHFFPEGFGDSRGPKHFREQKPKMAAGSGFFISEDGLIMTNHHVIDNAQDIQVSLNDGRQLSAKIIGSDPNTDLAILQVEGSNFPTLEFGNSQDLEVGEWVIAVGNQLGGFQATLTVGVVSAKGRSLSLTNYEDFIQTDAAINGGNSGGPLLNIEGQVIGVNTAIATCTGGHMGLGFAIPSAITTSVMEQLLEKGSVARGYIGVALQQVDHDLAQAFALKQIQGVVIAEVTPNSPAQKAQLQAGDIILSYNNSHVDSLNAFRNAISLLPEGTTVTLEILRNNEKLLIPVTIEPHPTFNTLSHQTQSLIGFFVENITPSLKKELQLPEEQGVVITKVDPNSKAAFAGIKRGTILLAINQQKIQSVQDFEHTIQTIQPEQGVLLLLKQDGVTRYLFLKG